MADIGFVRHGLQLEAVDTLHAGGTVRGLHDGCDGDATVGEGVVSGKNQPMLRRVSARTELSILARPSSHLAGRLTRTYDFTKTLYGSYRA